MSRPIYDPDNLARLSVSAKPVIEEMSLIIPTVGRDLLANCLEYVLNGSHWPGEILIVDQGTHPLIAIWVGQAREKGLSIQHERLQAVGKSASLNYGFSLVHSKFVTIIDDDCLVNADWLYLLHQRLSATPGVIISGRVDADEAETSVSTITDSDGLIYEKPLLKNDPLYGGNMGIAMRHVRRIGDFDESAALRFAEDNDFGYRAMRSGVPIVYAPEVRLLHVSWRDEGQRARRYQAYAHSQGGFYGKHMRRADWFMFVRYLRDQIRGPIRWLRGTLSENADDAASGRALTLYLLPGVIAGFKGE